jgi:hypothetical protein
VSVFEVESEWAIALYAKHGRVYSEIGVFLEAELDAMEAYEAFAEICGAIPAWQAVEHAIQFEKIYPEEPTPHYEVRLYSKQDKRIVATILWLSSSIEECKEHYKQRVVKNYNVHLELELDAEDSIESPENWDWDELYSTGKIKVIDIMPSIV